MSSSFSSHFGIIYVLYIKPMHTTYQQTACTCFIQKWFKSTTGTGFAAKNDGKKLGKVFILREYVTHTQERAHPNLPKHTAFKAMLYKFQTFSACDQVQNCFANQFLSLARSRSVCLLQKSKFLKVSASHFTTRQHNTYSNLHLFHSRFLGAEIELSKIKVKSRNCTRDLVSWRIISISDERESVFSYLNWAHIFINRKNPLMRQPMVKIF